MDSQFADLLDFAARIGIEIRHAHLGGNATGLAHTKSRRILVIDLDAPALDQLQQTVRALAREPQIQTEYLRPDLRQLLEEWTEDK